MTYTNTIEMRENNRVGFFLWLWGYRAPINEFGHCYSEQKVEIFQFSTRLSAADLEQGKLQTATQGEMLSQQQHAT